MTIHQVDGENCQDIWSALARENHVNVQCLDMLFMALMDVIQDKTLHAHGLDF